jgi:hypothetical protein
MSDLFLLVVAITGFLTVLLRQCGYFLGIRCDCLRVFSKIVRRRNG